MFKIGFTNKMACFILGMLAVGMLLSYKLSVLSIEADYMGALACWTVVFTPMATALSITLTAVVNKSKAENTGENGDGIIYRNMCDQHEGGGYK